MKNYDTFAPENIVDIENWIIVGQAFLKMAVWFWPAVLVMACLFIYEHMIEKQKDEEKRVKKM